MRAEFQVEYDLYDMTALQDAKESSESNADFGNLRLLKEEVRTPAYGTMEHNLFVLDGSMEEFPNAPDDLAYFSSGQSGEDGTFSKKQSVTLQFAEQHTSVGVTLYFSDIYPLEIEIVWYDLSGTEKSRKIYFPDAKVYYCENQVEEYGRIDVIFLRALPLHNVKLQGVKYGATIVWGDDSIKAAGLVNDTDPISDRIATDKLTFEFVDTTDSFNIGNAGGLHRTFQKTQRMIPYEIVNGEKLPLGVFFLDSNSTTKNVSRITAIDYKGMLANADFKEGRMYAGDPAGTVIREIMEAAGITEYVVDEETAATPLYGTLGIQTCQRALREVLFACGSSINTSRRAGVEIHKANRLITARIPRSRKFSTTLQTDHYVSDVNVKYKTWTLEEKTSEITKGTYGAGIHTIHLSNPAANMTVNVGSIRKQTPYYVILEIPVQARADVVIFGQKYVGEELAVLSRIEHIKAGEVRSTKTYTGTLLNFASAQRAADSILEYFQLQQIIQTKHLSESEKAGDWVEVENVSKDYGNFIAAIESMSTDLTGGFISTAKYRGYYKRMSDYDYSGGEIYGGEEAGVI